MRRGAAAAGGLERPAFEPGTGELAREHCLLCYASDALVLFDESGEAAEVGPSYTRVLGYTPAQRCDMRTAEVLHAGDIPRWQRAWSAAAARPAGRATVVLRVRHANGSWHWTDVTLLNALHDPAARGVVATIRDLGVDNGRHRPPSALAGGPVDGAGGRRRALLALSEVLATLSSGSQRVLVLVVKIDQVDLVSRVCGAGAAAGLVAAASRRLRGSLRAGDRLTRLGADRVAVVAKASSDRRAAGALAGRLAACLREAFEVEGEAVVLSASIGIATISDPGASVEGVLDDAELAAATAFAEGGNRRRFAGPTDRADAMVGVTLPAVLRQALRGGEFVVHYQPVVEMGSGQAVGAEALLRWARPSGALAGPEDFIGAAERSGVIAELGEWVLQRACRDAVRWPGGSTGPLCVAVNLCAHQLADPRLTTIVRRSLGAAGLAPSRLVLEVTESVIMADPALAGRRLGPLRAAGVRVAVDDFGTGYSSLAYLKRLPVDVLKIDRCFVAALGTSSTDAAIVAAILALARALGLYVVAEGVETEAQAGELRRMGCSHAQGYLYGRPTAAVPTSIAGDAAVPPGPEVQRRLRAVGGGPGPKGAARRPPWRTGPARLGSRPR